MPKLAQFQDPKMVGSSEYHSIVDTLTSVKVVDDDLRVRTGNREGVRAILEEYIRHATGMLKELDGAAEPSLTYDHNTQSVLNAVGHAVIDRGHSPEAVARFLKAVDDDEFWTRVVSTVDWLESRYTHWERTGSVA